MDKTINSYINQLHLDPKKEKAVRQIVELAGGSGGGMTEVTYAELRELRDNGKLVPGAKYRMIDYETVVVDDAYEYNRDENDVESFKIASENFPFDLILTAIDENNLDERCNAVWSERDVYGYFANSDLLAWDVRYSIDSYKYIWSAEHNATVILFDYYFGDFVKGYLDIPMSEKYDSQIFKIPALSNKKYTAYAVPSNNESANIVVVYEDGREETITSMSILNIYNKQGKGTIYRLTDEHNNSCPYDFKNFKAYYGNNFEFTFGANDPVDVSTVYNTGNVNNNYIGERNYYGYRSKINISSFNLFKDSWAEQAHITNNHIGNNTLFNGIFGNNNIIGDNAYYNLISGNYIILNGNNSSNNINGANIILNKYCSTNNIIGENITFEDNCTNNELKHSSTDYSNKCYNITFGSNCNMNVLDDSKNVTFGSACKHNNIKGTSIKFDSACSSNEIKTSDVTFSSNCTYNTITGGQYITFGKDCTRNTIESGITITLGSSCNNNVFSGNNLEKCHNVTLGNECTNNELMCLRHITFGNYCTGNKFSCDNTTQPGCIFKTKFEDNCSNLIYVQHLTNTYTSPYNIKLNNCTLPSLNHSGNTSTLRKYITYLRQRNDGTIITYTDEDIYDAIQATTVEPTES